jgi:UDP-N-acetylmuramyl tripeptide synthase
MPPSRLATPPRTRAAVLAGKLIRAASRRWGGGGTALPGLVAERIDAGLVARLAAQLDDAVLVTGTNGKTTTARMLAAILGADGRFVVHNRAGSNLTRGIAAALIEAASPAGRLPPGAAGVFETDEATLSQAAAAVVPRVLVIGNLFRDQLDRYGEIEAIRGQWLETIAALPPETMLVLNADDPSVSSLARAATGPVLQFGIDDHAVAQPPGVGDHALDAIWDEATGADYEYDRRFYAHLGHWRCPAAGLERPPLDLSATAVDLAADGGIAFRVGPPLDPITVRSPLPGLYNVYNALAALAAAQSLGVPNATAAAVLAGTAAAFGRQEQLSVAGHPVRILLGKNPAGVNAALRSLDAPAGGLHLLVLLNDGLADGTDVSWTWDTDWELLTAHVASLVVGGTRAADMALRLRYAGFPEPIAVSHDIETALTSRLDNLPDGAPLTVLPTYTALLGVRALLGDLSGARRIWEGA